MLDYLAAARSTGLRRELCLFLLTLYTPEFSINSPGCHLQKFSDSTICGLITGVDDSEYRQCTWHGQHFVKMATSRCATVQPYVFDPESHPGEQAEPPDQPSKMQQVVYEWSECHVHTFIYYLLPSQLG
ncbi:hypothetical protein XENORESO_014104 [Xenotaenia resolanae]|uniref:Uncharacterized protein n=1 Tax=Xenotaenia resolanae TaxID=208358 RepID=A0ABV0VZL2_9TELE